MKLKIAIFLIAAFAVALPALGQSLADRARELRKQKRTPAANEKVYTNESLSLRPAPSISETKPTDAKDAKTSAAEEGEDAPTPEEQKAALAADFRARITKAQGELATLQREVNIATRENQIQTAQFYADAGNRLRDEKKFAEEQRRILADVQDKQRKITETQALIEQLRDQARRAGLPPGQIP